MQKQGSIGHPLRDLANCSKLRMANVGWAEFKPHLRGSSELSPSQQRTASCCPPEGSWGPAPNPAAACWPLCKVSGSVDTVPEPSGCTQPPSLSSCDRRQAALSAAGCECSLPEMKTCKKFWCPNPPNRGTRPQEGRRHGICRVERGLAELCRSKAASCIPRGNWRTAASCAWRVWDGLSSSHISRGSWGQGPLQQRSAVWSQGPNQQQSAAPLRKKD